MTATNTPARKEGECVDVIIVTDGEAREIADLVLALQGQRNPEVTSPSDLMIEVVRSTIDGIGIAKPES